MNYPISQVDLKLGADSTNADTSWTITVPTILAGFVLVNPSGVGRYRAVIESEVVYFTSGAVTAGTQTWTVTRAQEGTTGAIHLSGTVLKLEATAGAVANAVQLTPTAQQTGTVNVSGAVTSGGLLTGTGLSAAHASTQEPNGSDPLYALYGHAPSTRVETTPRMGTGVSASMASGQVVFSYVTPPFALTITGISFLTTSSPSGLSLVRAGLYTVDGSGNLTLVAATADAHATVTANNTFYTLALAVAGDLTTSQTSYPLLRGTRYAVAIIQVGTPAQLVSITGNNVLITTQVPRMTGTRSSQADLPTSLINANVAALNAQFYFSLA